MDRLGLVIRKHKCNEGVTLADEVFKEMQRPVKLLQSEFQKGNPISGTWDYETAFLTIGGCALSLMYGNFDRDKFVQLLLDKHKLYGAGPLTEWGPLGIMIRIHSKIGRYANVRGTTVAHESALDTLVDILGYCVLGHHYPYAGKGPAHGQNDYKALSELGASHGKV